MDHNFVIFSSRAILICYQTLEVATARVYNWDIGQRRKERIDNGDGNDDEDKSGAK